LIDVDDDDEADGLRSYFQYVYLYETLLLYADSWTLMTMQDPIINSAIGCRSVNNGE